MTRNLFGKNDHCQTGDIKQQHDVQHPFCSGRCPIKFLPDIDAPECSNDSCSLPQAIGDCGSCLAGSDYAQGHTDTPDGAAQQTNQVISNPFALK